MSTFRQVFSLAPLVMTNQILITGSLRNLNNSSWHLIIISLIDLIKLIQILTNNTGADWTHGMSFISLNQISPGLISSGMGHDHFTGDCCLGKENGCFLSTAHLSIDDHAKFCKLPQVLRNSCSGLVQHYPILQSEFHWLNAPYLLLLWSVIVMSLYVWWLHVLMTTKTLYLLQCLRCSCDRVLSLSARDWHRYWHRSGGW